MMVTVVHPEGAPCPCCKRPPQPISVCRCCGSPTGTHRAEAGEELAKAVAHFLTNPASFRPIDDLRKALNAYRSQSHKC